jgi:hypothetical protein
MKGKIITGRAVVTDDMIRVGIIKGTPARKINPKGRYARQHREKPKK